MFARKMLTDDVEEPDEGDLTVASNLDE